MMAVVRALKPFIFTVLLSHGSSTCSECNVSVFMSAVAMETALRIITATLHHVQAHQYIHIFIPVMKCVSCHKSHTKDDYVTTLAAVQQL